MKKITVGILFGGRSAEHEVSIRSAKSLYEALDKEKYAIHLIGISQEGNWIRLPTTYLIADGSSEKEALQTSITVAKKERGVSVVEDLEKLDVCFPVLHGPFGEDGTVQGLLKLMNIPFVGAGVLGSAVGMDKDVMKRLLREAGIPISKFTVVRKGELLDYDTLIDELGLPLFVKPANLGSSVGVSKVKTEAAIKSALSKAFRFDNKIILEEFIEGRELEVSVLGNDSPNVSVVGEVIPKHEFYSYEAKYLDENGAELVIPAQISKKTSDEIRRLAKHVFTVLECSDMARVDFFLRKDGKVFVNEINTIPGFTSISMYPKLWEATGLPYAQLIDTLITLALTRYNKDQRLKTTYA